MKPFIYEPAEPRSMQGHVFHIAPPEVMPVARPCPFCGCPDVEITNTHTASYWAVCCECGAEVHGAYFDGGTQEEDHRKSFESAAENWNRREE